MVLYEAAAKMHAVFWNKCAALNTNDYTRSYADPYWTYVFPFVYKVAWPDFKNSLKEYDIEYTTPKWAF